jgi:DNA-directed RNA polymerase subunit H (RpoH/RPB5)
MESMNEPAEMIIYENLKKFIKYRNIKTDYVFKTIDKFSVSLNTLQYELIEGKDAKDNPICIFLVQSESKYGKKADEFKKLINRFVKNCSDVIYITDGLSSSYINKKINEYRDENQINIFAYTYEYFIIVLPETDSSFKHEVTPEEEFDFYCKRLYISKEHLPKIDAYNDPQLVWIGAKRGDIIRISGKSETAQEVEEYRLAI